MRAARAGPPYSSSGFHASHSARERNRTWQIAAGSDASPELYGDGVRSFIDRKGNQMRAQEIVPAPANVIARTAGTIDPLSRCIEECSSCAQVCTLCADACLGAAQIPGLIQCIRLALDCADLCVTTGTIAGRQAGNNETVIAHTIAACAVACARCAEECAQHTSHEHCQRCADACIRCEEACRAALQLFGEMRH